jgi:hypothetical protein
MKYLLLILAIFILTSCAMGKPSISFVVNNGVPVSTANPEKLFKAGEGQSTDPSVNNPTSALSSSGGVTIIIKQQTVESSVPVGINATIPASSLGGL